VDAVNTALRPHARLGVGLATLLCLGVGGYAMAAVATDFAVLGPEVLRDGVHPALAAHVATAGVALLLLPWQLWPVVRRRVPRVHHWLGRVYAVAAVLGGGSGVAAALVAPLDLVTTLGFSALGAAWIAATVRAVQLAGRRDLPGHRDWAVRSFALGFAAVTLRLWLPLLLASGLAFTEAYAVVAWLCWVPNLLVAEWVVRGRRTASRVAVA
jgi:hypothetical protein